MEGYQYALHPTRDLVMPQIPKKSAAKGFEREGLIPRSIRELFRMVDQKREQVSSKITVHCQFIQLYNERVYDLLNSDLYKVIGNKRMLDGVPGLKIKIKTNNDVQIENVYQFECQTVEDGFKYFWKGLKNKMMASHRLNNSSSRSHCILTFTVTQTDIKDPENAIVSKLQLVDLAGSERQSHVESSLGEYRDPQNLKEAIEINKSLFNLRQVITALTENSKQQQKQLLTRTARESRGGFEGISYIPYRESKLTTILRQSLGGNSYCLMIANLSPISQFLDESMSTLQYASKASNISNQPKLNQDPRSVLIMEQRQALERMSKELKMANDQIKFLAGGGNKVSNCSNCEVFQQRITQLENIIRAPSQASASPSSVENQVGAPSHSGSLAKTTEDSKGQNDRLIHSISMIKDMLLSNMQLREEQLKLAE